MPDYGDEEEPEPLKTLDVPEEEPKKKKVQLLSPVPRYKIWNNT